MMFFEVSTLQLKKYFLYEKALQCFKKGEGI
jgi:hypothetical protein